MKVYSIPKTVRALLFDIDNTLYRNDEYCNLQVELLLERFAERQGISIDEAKGRIDHEKRVMGKSSTGNLMMRLGVSIEENARWRDELFHPDNYLVFDHELVAMMRVLRSRYLIAAVTNNTVGIGRRTLEVLGVGTMIRTVIGLDTCYISKPAVEPYARALSELAIPPGQAISVGDRYEVDIELPLQMGLGGILVECMEDLYGLPEFLLKLVKD